MLRGFELDPFAWEVSKLCLMLADFPNHNGWMLKNEDVFDSPAFDRALGEASIVLCNPPFGKFLASQRSKYPSLHSLHKPAELIYRILKKLKQNGMIGFVLPFQFLDGQSYRETRRLVARNFGDIQIVDLPEHGVFRKSEHKAVILLASHYQHVRTSVTVD